jgi:hypothetical protein
MNLAPRQYCRNSRCRSKLREPVENHHHAFCCKGCFETFYLRRCRVCERDISNDPLTGEARKRLSRRKYCGRKCANEAERFSRAYAWIGSQPTKREMNSRNAHEMGIESGSRGRPTNGMFSRAGEGCGWRWEGDEFEYRLIDRNGGLAARIEAEVGSRWRLTHPRTSTVLSAPDLASGRRLAVSLALANLPLERKAAAKVEGVNAKAAPSPMRERPVVTTFNCKIAEGRVPGDPGPMPGFLRRDGGCQ